MILIINDAQRDLPAGAGAARTLEEVLQSLAEDFRDEGLLVTQVILNGTDVTGKPQEEVHALGAPQKVEIRARRPEELVADSLAVTAEMVGPLQRELAECADKLRIGDEANATLMLFRVIDSFQLLKMGVSHIGRILRMQLPDVDRGVLDEFIDRLDGQLSEVVAAQESQDLILLADLLEYEIGESLEEWQQQVSEMGKRLCRVEA